MKKYKYNLEKILGLYVILIKLQTKIEINCKPVKLFYKTQLNLYCKKSRKWIYMV